MLNGDGKEKKKKINSSNQQKKKTILQVDHIFLDISLLLLLKCEIVFTDFLFLCIPNWWT